MEMKSRSALNTTCKRAFLMSWELFFGDLEFSSIFFVEVCDYFHMVSRLYWHRLYKSKIDLYSAK